MVRQKREVKRKRNKPGCFYFVSNCMKLSYSIFVISIVLFSFSSCAFKAINRNKNITYLPADSNAYKPLQKLNVFAPKKTAVLKEVLIFVHGGRWNSGKKGLYSFFRSPALLAQTKTGCTPN